ncbi:glycoside hydrolase family 43 protein [Aspergillus mulundensis]|uniref:Beta-1,4-xylosidase n=1 Tax=Aspergillus mulundensis TaxID=1810919 RepID=A0A3D8S604_9EURO|nr:Beta-1,4-xylosidase [Aspergillus mulundensis]RDW81729.1 Beta-1,4-xylosidase [Aspergillus mulundensis]
MPDPRPLITHLYTADPSAHVFSNRLYIYPSHDRDTGIPSNDNGDQYDMADYHVFSIDSLSPNASEPIEVTDHGTVLKTEQVPWASKQLWAPDAAERNGKYYLFFPARDGEGLFRIGVAVGESPAGPFRPQELWLQGSFSIDPAVFVDENVDSDDGDGKEAFIYFGGLWGGQLQSWVRGEDGVGWTYDKDGKEPTGPGVPALSPLIAKLSQSMTELASPVRPLVILDESGGPLAADDHDRRFFEAAWMHKYNGTYYFSYSTGDTHYLVYATSDSPWGPFTYRGRILEPVLGWTTHHSIVEFEGKWWLFYHDCEISKGQSHLRNVKVREIGYREDGTICLVD